MSISIEINGQRVKLLDNHQMTLFNNKTRQPDNFLIDTFFPNGVSFPNENRVALDELDTKHTLAPFVVPDAQSEAIELSGKYRRKIVEAPYMKPNRTITPKVVRDHALLGLMYDAGIISRIDTMTKAEQWRVAQVATANMLITARDNRMKLMATDIIKTGRTRIVGDAHPAYTMDFGRNENLSFTPKTKWDQAGATPVTDIETMNQLLIDHDGTGAIAAITSSKCFSAMVSNEEFKERFVKAQAPGGGDANPFPAQFNRADKAQFRGTLDGIAFWTYDAVHTLEGIPKRFIETHEFFLVSDMSGFNARCQIEHVDVDGQALDYYMYMVKQEDPSGVKMVLDSSPLLVPATPNGVVGGNNFLAGLEALV